MLNTSGLTSLGSSMYSLSSQSAGCTVKGILETILCILAKKPFGISLILNNDSLTPTGETQEHAASIF